MINDRANNPFPITFNTLRQCVLLGIAIISSLSPLSQAQSNNQRWYQVEIVIFARQNPDSQEHWPTNIKLGYPLNWVELKDPNNLADQSGATNSPAPADSAQQASVDLLHDPFYLLPDSDKKLRNHAAALQRDPRYRILAHQAWRQFIMGRPPVSGHNSHSHPTNYVQKYWPLIVQSPLTTCRTLINGRV